jgi:hypothetical protein
MPFRDPSKGEALELRLTRERDRLRLDEKVPLPIRDLPRDYRPEPDPVAVNFYYEIHDRNGLVFRGTASDPTGARIETLAPERAETRGGEEDDHPFMELHDTNQESSHFNLVVPRFQQPTQIVIFSKEMARVFDLPPDEPVGQFDL